MWAVLAFLAALHSVHTAQWPPLHLAQALPVLQTFLATCLFARMQCCAQTLTLVVHCHSEVCFGISLPAIIRGRQLDPPIQLICFDFFVLLAVGPPVELLTYVHIIGQNAKTGRESGYFGGGERGISLEITW